MCDRGKCDLDRRWLLYCLMICVRAGVEVWEVIDLTVDICGIYQERCQSSERGSEGTVEWFYVRMCDEAGRQQQQDKQVHKEFTLFLLQFNITNLFLFLSVLFLFMTLSLFRQPSLSALRPSCPILYVCMRVALTHEKFTRFVEVVWFFWGFFFKGRGRYACLDQIS